MKLFNWLFGSFIEEIKFNGTASDIISKASLDGKEISYNAKLIVPSGYVALITNRKQSDTLSGGEHNLNIDTLPNIAKSFKWSKDADSPFNANIFYINAKSFTNNFKTDEPLLIRDLKNHIIKLNLSGSYNIKIVDANILLNSLFKNRDTITTKDIKNVTENLFLLELANVLANRVIPLTELLSNKSELNKFLILAYNNKFENYGLYMEKMDVSNIDYEEESSIYTGITNENAIEEQEEKIYFLVKENSNIGPFTKETIRELLAQKEINLNSYIWRDGLKDWIKIKDLRDL